MLARDFRLLILRPHGSHEVLGTTRPIPWSYYVFEFNW